jgi:hypothetical protein
METLYVAYNDECDSARVNSVRKQLLGTGRYLIEGYMPFTTWSKTKLGCSTDEIKRNIEDGLVRCCATLILIGPDAAANPWIRYAIERSYKIEIPMIALYINQLPDERGESAEADLNPLERFAVMERGKKIYLSDRHSTYTWSGVTDGKFERWLDQARYSRARPAPGRSSEAAVRAAAAISAAGSHQNITNHGLDTVNL